MNTRFLKVTLKDCGKSINVPNIDTAKVVINAERKDGQAKGFDGVINEDGTVTVPLHSWMLELDGTVICDISVIDTATDDNKKLTTTSFTLLVEKAAYGGNDITSDPQYDVLVNLLETCNEASVAAQEALDKSNEANRKYDACVEATEKANEAANTLNDTKEELERGGFITGIKEKNKGNVLGFWVGTTEEYEALPEPPQDCYVILTDDKTLGDIIQKISSLQKTCDETSEELNTLSGKFNKVLYEGEILRGNSYEIPNLSDYTLFSIDGILCVKEPNVGGTSGYIRGCNMNSGLVDYTAMAFLNISAISLKYEGNTIYFGSSEDEGYGNIPGSITTYNQQYNCFSLEFSGNTTGDAGMLAVRGEYQQPMGFSKIIGIM